MSVPGLLISLLLALIAIAIVAYPHYSAAAGGAEAVSDDHLDRVGNYYERVLTNIRDLDEDLATGKISDDDHRREREVWVARGIALLRLQDQWDAQQASAYERQNSEAVDRAIEAAVAAYRESKGSPAQSEGLN